MEIPFSLNICSTVRYSFRDAFVSGGVALDLRAKIVLVSVSQFVGGL